MDNLVDKMFKKNIIHRKKTIIFNILQLNIYSQSFLQQLTNLSQITVNKKKPDKKGILKIIKNLNFFKMALLWDF